MTPVSEVNPNVVLHLLYVDSAVAAVAKPSGLLVHRSAEAPDRDTCMTRLRAELGRWVYPVHRLDRGASGVLLFALDPGSARVLCEAFASRAMKKTYLAVVRGVIPPRSEIDHAFAGAPTGRDAAPSCDQEPPEARTLVRRIAHVELPYPVGPYPTARFSLAEAAPITGRRHQIRRHMAHIHHPIIGDVNYGDGRNNRLFRDVFGVRRLLLHAEAIRFPHPATSEIIDVRAPLTDELSSLFERLGFLDAIAAERSRERAPHS